VIGLGHAGDLARAIERANGFVSARILRSYQRDNALEGKFSLCSPFDGKPTMPVACHVFNLGDAAHGNLGIAYRFDGARPFWLLASSVKDGFPLTEAYLPTEDRSIWSLDENLTALHGPWKAELARLEHESQACLSSLVDSQPTVLVGHPNFAHHLWNELPALRTCLELVARTGCKAPRVQVLYEPLLPLARLMPQGAQPVSRVSGFCEVTGLRDALVTRLGSTRVSTSLRERVVASLADATAGRLSLVGARERLAKCSPVFWLSVRVDARTADNQVEFLLSLVPALAKAYPDCGFIVDGFSYPADFSHAIYRQGESADGLEGETAERGFLDGAMRRREQDVGAAIGSLIRQLEQRCHNPLVVVSGRDIPEAAALASLADYYVCHTGTLQHKVAWLHNTPGMVHANRAGLRPGAARWLADQLESGWAPSLLPLEFVQDLDSIRSPNQVERNRDYHFLDIPGVVAAILTDAGRVLGAG
jgi:hypothetical protein